LGIFCKFRHFPKIILHRISAVDYTEASVECEQWVVAESESEDEQAFTGS